MMANYNAFKCFLVISIWGFASGQSQVSLCTRCKHGSHCSPNEGICESGCRLWWAGPKCDIEIALPMHQNESTEVTQTTRSTILITWEPLLNVPTNGANFYGYLIGYSERSTKNPVKGPIATHNPTTKVFEATVRNLKPATSYQLKVWPFREMNNEIDYGDPYDSVEAQTRAEDPPNFLDPDGDVGCNQSGQLNAAWALFGVSFVVIVALILCNVYMYLKYVKKTNLPDISNVLKRRLPLHRETKSIDPPSSVLPPPETDTSYEIPQHYVKTVVTTDRECNDGGESSHNHPQYQNVTAETEIDVELSENKSNPYEDVTSKNQEDISLP